MRTLTKHNTALDLSKLTEGELNIIGRVYISPYRYLFFDKDVNLYAESSSFKDEGLTLVDFQTFCKLHFPEQDDKPTYEELVEALRVAIQVVDRPDIYRELEQLLERIK